jgi:hypothetical protein
MSEPTQQNLKNHASIDPLFHFVAAALLLFSFCLGVVILVQSITRGNGHLLISLWIVAVSLALLILWIKSRVYPLKVQDRVIRLEERLRLAMLLPEKLRNRLHELTESQLIALRFASDDEVPALVELALDKKLSRKEIKERIQNWRPDHWRI